jgi:hypothetical protein
MIEALHSDVHLGGAIEQVCAARTAERVTVSRNFIYAPTFTSISMAHVPEP